ncbi:cytochrome b5 domain-containing protein 1 [Alligator mississippiensis]|uniref:Cytochrome b5 domain-containing protein 1 n=1 Tax=Alligator mississippiensis TaxID=8496 RepID=A0A151N439_ALLMI|nr:cytochrome b5 domain-containing protein 1 [Alligator mississippiensis]
MEPGRRPRYFTPREVEAHARPRDLWVSFLGRVHDLTPLAREHEGDVLLRPILEAAGTDITHWFNPKTRDLQTCVDPLTGCPRYYTPQGRVLHVPPLLPRSDWANDFGVPWWKDVKYEVGILSAKTRLVRVINTLTSQEHMLEVCAEESLWEILRRYLPNNAHAGSYTWKHAASMPLACCCTSMTTSPSSSSQVQSSVAANRYSFTQVNSLQQGAFLEDANWGKIAEKEAADAAFPGMCVQIRGM